MLPIPAETLHHLTTRHHPDLILARLRDLISQITPGSPARITSNADGYPTIHPTGAHLPTDRILPPRYQTNPPKSPKTILRAYAAITLPYILDALQTALRQYTPYLDATYCRQWLIANNHGQFAILDDITELPPSWAIVCDRTPAAGAACQLSPRMAYDRIAGQLNCYGAPDRLTDWALRTLGATNPATRDTLAATLDVTNGRTLYRYTTGAQKIPPSLLLHLRHLAIATPL